MIFGVLAIHTMLVSYEMSYKEASFGESREVHVNYIYVIWTIIWSQFIIEIWLRAIPKHLLCFLFSYEYKVYIYMLKPTWENFKYGTRSSSCYGVISSNISFFFITLKWEDSDSVYIFLSMHRVTAKFVYTHAALDIPSCSLVNER